MTLSSPLSATPLIPPGSSDVAMSLQTRLADKAPGDIGHLQALEELRDTGSWIDVSLRPLQHPHNENGLYLVKDAATNAYAVTALQHGSWGSPIPFTHYRMIQRAPQGKVIAGGNSGPYYVL